MGLAEDAGILVEEEALEPTCVCRVDSDVDTSGDGKTWETAMRTVEECVSALEPEVAPDTPCEVWVKGNASDGEIAEIQSAFRNIRIINNVAGQEARRKNKFIPNNFSKIGMVSRPNMEETWYDPPILERFFKSLKLQADAA